MSLLEQFFLLKHYKDGKIIATEEVEQIKTDAKAYVNSLTTSCKTVSLKCKDPVSFAARYLFLLDNGFCPVLIPNELAENQTDRIHQHTWTSSTYGCLTSGTTGNPKISFHSVEGAKKLAESHARSLLITSTDIITQALPLTHAFGVVCYIWTSLQTSAPINFLTVALTSNTWNSFITKHSVVHLSPSMGRLLIKGASQNLTCPRVASVGAGVFYQHEFSALQQLLPESKVYVTYGFTEAGPRVSTGLFNKNLPLASVGKFLDIVEVAVLSNGKLKKHGHGRLCVKSPAVKLNLDLNEVLDGFIISQDEVEVNQDGYIQYIDRVDDLIKVGGVSIYPSDILEIFKKIFPVQEAVILKEAHPIYGEVPILLIEGQADQQINIKDKLYPSLTALQRPKKIICIDKFPRNSFGKIDRKSLRELMI